MISINYSYPLATTALNCTKNVLDDYAIQINNSLIKMKNVGDINSTKLVTESIENKNNTFLMGISQLLQ